ncbi:MAG: YraN family protein [Chloroflexota bacterium]
MKDLNVSTRIKGSRGEQIAARYLESEGFEIVKTNFIFGKYGEIDIIARLKGEIIFVEVKTRSNTAYGDPLESITWAKIKKIRRAAEGYLYINKIEDVPVRFDVIVVDMMTDPPNINHLVNAM